MPLVPGDRLGPYEIVAQVGEGGMGEVYKAKDPRLRRTVAVKVLPGSFARDQERVRRFETEARAAGALNHPNILVVHDIGTAYGTPYLVSELLEGETLREKLRSGRLSPHRAMELARQIAAGLGAAHAKGIVHRDLKPDNIFVTRDGRAKILDFGLAKLGGPMEAEGEDATRTLATDPGVIVGTMAYMSPEQVRAQAVDARSDLFSFGCVLYEMLTGRRAFRGGSAADTISAILHSDPLDRPESELELPAPLTRILRHCLEKDASERFQSAKDLGFDLEAVSASAASGLSVVGPLGEPVNRRRWKLLVGCIAGALAIAGGFAVTRLREQAPVFERLTFRRGFVDAARFAPDGRTVIYGASWAGRRPQIFATESGQPESRAIGEPGTMLFAISQSAEMAEAINASVHHWVISGTLARMPLAGGTPRELKEGIAFADWTPDGSELAVVTEAGRLEFPPGHELYQPSGTGWVGEIRFSPKGDRIALVDHDYAGDDGTIAVIDRQGTKRTLTPEYVSVQGLAWSPDGSEIWFTGSKGAGRELRAVSLSGSERTLRAMAGGFTLRDVARDGRVLLSRENQRREIEMVGPGEARPRDLSWLDWSYLTDLSDDGSLVAMKASGQGVSGKHVNYVRKTDGAAPVRLSEGTDGVALSPDGMWLLESSGLNENLALRIVPLHAGIVVGVQTGNVTPEGRVMWLPDGRHFAYTGTVAGKSRVYVQEIGGGSQGVTAEGATLLGVPPDGRRLLCRTEGLDLLYPVMGGDPEPTRGLNDRDEVLRFAGEGTAVFVRPPDDELRIDRVDIATGKREQWARLAPLDAASVRAIQTVRLTPDGKTIAYDVERRTSELYLATGVR